MTMGLRVTYDSRGFNTILLICDHCGRPIKPGEPANAHWDGIKAHEPAGAPPSFVHAKCLYGFDGAHPDLSDAWELDQFVALLIRGLKINPKKAKESLEGLERMIEYLA